MFTIVFESFQLIFRANLAHLSQPFGPKGSGLGKFTVQVALFNACSGSLALFPNVPEPHWEKFMLVIDLSASSIQNVKLVLSYEAAGIGVLEQISIVRFPDVPCAGNASLK